MTRKPDKTIPVWLVFAVSFMAIALASWLVYLTLPAAPEQRERAGNGAVDHSAVASVRVDPAQKPSLKVNELRWSTASEKDSFGYDVFRAESKAGPFEKINAEVIPGAGTTDMPQRYSYTDTAIKPNTVYWYYIESISLQGVRRKVSPTYASKPKPARQPGQ